MLLPFLQQQLPLCFPPPAPYSGVCQHQCTLQKVLVGPTAGSGCNIHHDTRAPRFHTVVFSLTLPSIWILSILGLQADSEKHGIKVL